MRNAQALREAFRYVTWKTSDVPHTDPGLLETYGTSIRFVAHLAASVDAENATRCRAVEESCQDWHDPSRS